MKIRIIDALFSIAVVQERAFTVDVITGEFIWHIEEVKITFTIHP
jgi:hypothetical protein